jgi:hypothetical protein
MKRFKFGLTCMALVVMSCANAMAGVWLSNNGHGSVSGSFDAFTPVTGDMSGALSVTHFLYNPGASSRQVAFAGYTEPGNEVWAGTYNFASLGLTVGNPYVFSMASFGTFNGTIIGETEFMASALMGTGNRTLDFSGTFTPGTNTHYEGDMTVISDATLQIAFSRNDGGSVNVAWSLDTDPVPEPTSIAIFAFGAVGFAVRRFRRK